MEVLCILCIRKRVDFHNSGRRSSTNFHDFGMSTKNLAIVEKFALSWVEFLKIWHKVSYTFLNNWYKEQVCF